MVKRVVGVYVARALADHDRELGLVVDLLGRPWGNDRVVRADQRFRPLGKNMGAEGAASPASCAWSR
jgi:hypothetical protein